MCVQGRYASSGRVVGKSGAGPSANGAWPLDDAAEQALRTLEATGLSQSDAIRAALLTSARRLRGRRELAAEVAALEADDMDRAEMLAVTELMEDLRAAR